MSAGSRVLSAFRARIRAGRQSVRRPGRSTRTLLNKARPRARSAHSFRRRRISWRAGLGQPVRLSGGWRVAITSGSVRTQGSLASARRIRGMVRGRCWLVQTVHPRPRRSGRGAPRSAPGGSAAGPVGGGSTSGPAPRSTIARTRPTACCSPCAGVSAIQAAASATSLSCSSSAASRSRHETIRAWEVRFAPRLADPLRGEAARPGRRLLVPGRDLRERRRALVRSLSRHRPRGGAPRLHAQRAPGQARRPALPAAPGGRGSSASRRASRLMPIRPTAGRSAGSWGERCDPDAINPGTTASSRTTGPSSSALARCSASGASRLLCGAVPRSMRSDSTSASVNDGVSRSRWPISDDASSGRWRSLIAEMQAA